MQRALDVKYSIRSRIVIISNNYSPTYSVVVAMDILLQVLALETPYR